MKWYDYVSLNCSVLLGKGKKVGQLESGSQKDGLIEVNACAPLRRSFGQQAISPNSVDRLAGINHTMTQDKISLQTVGDASE